MMLRGNFGTLTNMFLFLLLYSYLKIVRITSLGMEYRFFETNRRISSVSDSNIVTRLASRSITGHELPIQVHQHYGVELHVILKPNNKHNGENETCMRRGLVDYCSTRTVCLQLEKSALEELYSCIYDDSRVPSMSDKVEHLQRCYVGVNYVVLILTQR